MPDISYKTLHENFVSNFNGTSLPEIVVVVSTAPVAVLLRNVAVAWLCVAYNEFSAMWVQKGVGLLHVINFDRFKTIILC